MRLLRYTHVEAECPFISYNDLLDRIEDLVVDVVDRVLNHPEAHLLYEINPVRRLALRANTNMNGSFIALLDVPRTEEAVQENELQ